MIKCNDWVRFWVNLETDFEASVFEAMLSIYNLGVNKKHKEEIIIDDKDCDYIAFEGSKKAKSAVDELVLALNTLLKDHDKHVAEQAINAYKREHNIKD